MSEIIDTFIELESHVWQALVAGDGEADRSLLAESFLGVYPTGFADRAGHAAQLEAGPTVERYEMTDARLRQVSNDAYLLSYLAGYVRPHGTGEGQREQMYISSLWERDGDRWVNTFSQDTPVELGSTP